VKLTGFWKLMRESWVSASFRLLHEARQVQLFISSQLRAVWRKLWILEQL